MKKLPDNIESASILVGQTDYVESTFGLFMRLKESSVMGDLIEVDTPTKFVFLLLGPIEETNIWEFQEIGRTVGTLFSDRVGGLSQKSNNSCGCDAYFIGVLCKSL